MNKDTHTLIYSQKLFIHHKKRLLNQRALKKSLYREINKKNLEFKNT